MIKFFTINAKSRIKNVNIIILIFILILSSSVQQTSAYLIDGEYQGLDGNNIAYNNFEGSYLLINAMQTTCHACIAQHPELQTLYDKNISGVEILSLAVGFDDDIAAVNNFNDEYTTPWHSGVDINHSAIEKFGISFTPTLMFFNPNGKMLFKNPGFAVSGVLEELIYRTTDIENTNIEESPNTSFVNSTETSTPTSLSSSTEDPIKSSSKNELPLDFHFLTILSSIIVIFVFTRSIKKLKNSNN